MAKSGSYSFTISALDDATAVLDRINKKMASVSAPVSRFNRSLQTFGDRSGISKIIEEFGNLGRTALKVAGSVAKILEPIGLLGSIGTAAGIAALTHHFATMGGEITRNALLLGMNTETLSKYITMAKLAGGTQEDLTSTFGSLEKFYRDVFVVHDADAVALNTKLGFTAADKDHPEQMLAKAYGLLQTLDPEAQQALRARLGLSSGLIKLEQPGALGRYGAEADKYAPSADQIKNADKLNDAFLRLEAAVNKFITNIESAFAPSFTALSQSANQFLDKLAQTLNPKLTQWAQEFSDWLGKVSPAEINKAVDDVIKAMGDVAGLVKTISHNLDIIAAYMIGGPRLAALVAAWDAAKAYGASIGAGALGVGEGVAIPGVTVPSDSSPPSIPGITVTPDGSQSPAAPATPGTPGPQGSAQPTGYGRTAEATAASLGVDFAALEASHGLPRGILAGFFQHEAGGNPHPRDNPNSTAKGPFQFIDGTAAQYHVDRSDLGSSARGAADYLRDLESHFGGDNRKTIAGYMAGQTAVDNLVKAYGDAWEQHLDELARPSEARDALSKIPGGLLPANPTPSDAVKPQSSIDLNGMVKVAIDHRNAPPGTTASVETSGSMFDASPGAVSMAMPYGAVS